MFSLDIWRNGTPESKIKLHKKSFCSSSSVNNPMFHGKASYTLPHKATLLHILNMCETILGENERLTWCHNSVLNCITLALKEGKPDQMQVYADLD
jgi:hypothetical protein